MKDNSNFEIYFSIIIPLYNKVEYIDRAIKSILNQTYQNFEIVVVNDGSTDRGEEIVCLYLSDRVKLINQQNQGVSSARNNGVLNSKYRYITFLDADDIWDMDFLKELNLLIKLYPNYRFFGLNNFFEFSNGQKIFEKYDWLFDGDVSGIICNFFAVFARVGKSPFSNSNYCITKNLFQDIGGYCVGVNLTEDSDLWCRVALNNEIVYLTKPLATYYVGTSGSTHLRFEPNEFQVTKTLKNALLANNVKFEHISSVKKLISFQQLSLIKRSILVGEKKFAFKRILNIELFRHYPFEFGKCVFSLIIPTFLIIKIQKIKGVC